MTAAAALLRPRTSRAAVGSVAVDSAIEVRALTKRFGATLAVDDLDLTVAPGQVFGFLGPNGAGKTTTIRMLLDLHRPSSGAVRVLGLDGARDAVKVHALTGYLPGELELPPWMTGRQIVDWFAAARGGVARDYRDQLVERFEVTLDRPIHELSKGNRQKIGVLLAFMHRPALALLDEPSSGLDPLMQEEFHRLLAETTADGRTVFLSSHELDEVQRVADRVAIIKDGRLVVTDSVEALRAQAPHTIEATFKAPVALAGFERIPGVANVTADGNRVSLRVNGELAPLLRLIADHEPLDMIARHADLDELFMTYYRDAAPADAH